MFNSEKLYQNITIIYAFILLLLFSIIYYLYFLNINLQLEYNILNQESYKSKIQLQTFIFFIITAVVLLVSQYLKTRFLKSKELKIQSRENLEIINTLYGQLQQFHSVKDISNAALKFFSKKISAKSAKLYIVDYQNEQLYLAGISNINIRDEEQVLNIYRGTMGEVVSFKKIKYIKSNSYYKVFIPLINENKTIATMIFYLENSNKDFKITTFEKTLVKIITDFLQKELKNEQNKKYFELIDNYVLTSSTNKDGLITYSSKAFENILGYQNNELLGKSHSLIRSSNIKDEEFKKMWNTISQGKTWANEIPNVKKDSTTCWLNTTVQPDFDYYGNIIGYTAIRTDITDKKIIEQISITDAMTNLYNRRYFDKIFSKRLNLSKRLNKKLAFCMMDIDHFKQYNDTYGHQDGDTALIKVAAILRKSLKREDDFVFRLGGEEFGLLYFTQNEQDALNIANKSRQNIEDIKIIHEKNSASSYVTVSMGLYIYDFKKEDLSAKDIYLKADKLLYKSKQNGRNQITI